MLGLMEKFFSPETPEGNPHSPPLQKGGRGDFLICLFSCLAFASPVFAAHGVAQFGEPKYPANFEHFDYVDPDAPKWLTF